MTYPEPYASMRRRYPDLVRAYEALGERVYAAGPLTVREQRLVELALAVGAGLEGAVHSQTRRTLRAGLSPEEIRHTVLLATTTLGFPATVRALGWADEVIARHPAAVSGEG